MVPWRKQVQWVPLHILLSARKYGRCLYFEQKASSERILSGNVRRYCKPVENIWIWITTWKKIRQRRPPVKQACKAQYDGYDVSACVHLQAVSAVSAVSAYISLQCISLNTKLPRQSLNQLQRSFWGLDFSGRYSLELVQNLFQNVLRQRNPV